MVSAGEQKWHPQRTFRHHREEIKCFADRKALVKESRNDAHGRAGSFDLARRVWKLGKLESQS